MIKDKVIIGASSDIGEATAKLLTRKGGIDVPLVLNNGSNSLVNQTWKGTDIVCVLWAMNNAKDVAYAQSAGSTPLRTFNTAATTNT